MLIVADENIPLLDEFFAAFGEYVVILDEPLMLLPCVTQMCCWCAR